jgi:hypothetical protein
MNVESTKFALAGSNWRHLNTPQIEEARVIAKLQHFLIKSLPTRIVRAASYSVRFLRASEVSPEALDLHA